jgi:hypothetical protein
MILVRYTSSTTNPSHNDDVGGYIFSHSFLNNFTKTYRTFGIYSEAVCCIQKAKEDSNLGQID